MPRLSFIFFLLLAGALFPQPGTAAEQVFTVTGVVRGRLDDGKLVIQHDEIPGYMPAMTMAFAVPQAADAAGLRSGDQVRFRFRVSATRSSAEAFLVTGHETVDGTKPAGPGTKSNRLRAGDHVPAFSLINENGQPFTTANLLQHSTVVTFIFTRCPVPEYCPAMALQFAQLQRAILANPQLASRARLLSITLDPEFDRPEILKAYGHAVGANSAVWQFATGDKSEVTSLTKAFAVYAERNGVTLDHTLCTAVIDGDGRLLELWRGNGWKTDEILAALTRNGTD